MAGDGPPDCYQPALDTAEKLLRRIRRAGAK